MSRSRALLLLILLAASAWGQTVERFVLDNGLRVLAEDRRISRMTRISVLVEAAPVHEGDLLGSGISLLTQRLLASAGNGELDLEADPEHVTFALTTTDDQAAAALERLARVVLEPSFTEEAFKAAQAAQARRLSSREDDLALATDEAIRRVLYRRHPARLPLAGEAARLASLGLEDVRRYHAERYVASRMVVTVAGNLAVGRSRALVERAFASARPGPLAPEHRPEEPQQFSERVFTTTGPVDRPRHVLLWRTWSQEFIKEQAALDLTALILQERLEARLIRVEGGQPLATAVSVSNHRPLQRPGWLAIAFDPVGSEAPVYSAINEVVRLLRDDAAASVSDEELASARRRWLRRDRQEQARIEARANELASWELAVGEPGYGQSWRRAIDAVGLPVVRGLFAGVLHPKGHNRCRVVLRPAAASDEPSGNERPAPFSAVPWSVTEVAGTRVISRYLPNGLVHVRLTLGGGTLVEDEAELGSLSLLAELLGDGPASGESDAFRAFLDERGIELRSSADARGLHLAATCFPDDLKRLLELLVETLHDPALPGARLERLRQERLADIDRGDWRERLLGPIMASLFAGHPAGLDHRGTGTTLASVDRERLLALHRRFARRNNLVIAVTGQADVQMVLNQVGDLLTNPTVLPAGETPTSPAPGWPEPLPGAGPTSLASEGTAGLALAWRGPDLATRDEHEAAFDVLAALLVGNGSHGLLGAALSQAGIDPQGRLELVRAVHPGRGAWIVLARLEPEELDPAKTAILGAVTALRTALAAAEGPATIEPARLAMARDLRRRERLLGEEDLAATSRRQALDLLRGRLPEREVDYVERVAAVDRTALAGLLDRVLTGQPVVVRLAPQPPEPVRDPAPEAAEGPPANAPTPAE